MQFKLTTREKSELFGEGVATVILLLLLNMSIFVIANQEIARNPGLAAGIFQIKLSLSLGPHAIRLWSWGWVFTGLMLLADAFIVYWPSDASLSSNAASSRYFGIALYCFRTFFASNQIYP